MPSTLLILHDLNTSDLFVLPGWKVGASWILATVSYALIYIGGVVVGILGKFSPDEYTAIPNF